MPYSEENKKLSKEYIKKVREETFCKNCGNQPIDFHREEHEVNGNLRVSRMAARGVPILKIAHEISLCEPLCRSCHMNTDGRMQKLRLSCPNQLGTIRVGKKPCVQCSKMEKPLRKGLCNACNHKQRRQSANHLR